MGWFDPSVLSESVQRWSPFYPGIVSGVSDWIWFHLYSMILFIKHPHVTCICRFASRTIVIALSLGDGSLCDIALLYKTLCGALAGGGRGNVEEI